MQCSINFFRICMRVWQRSSHAHLTALPVRPHTWVLFHHQPFWNQFVLQSHAGLETSSSYAVHNTSQVASKDGPSCLVGVCHECCSELSVAAVRSHLLYPSQERTEEWCPEEPGQANNDSHETHNQNRPHFPKPSSHQRKTTTAMGLGKKSRIISAV